MHVQRDNPFLSRHEMFRVITRSMLLYRRRHGGVSPRRVMIHKSTEFREEEALGCFDALPTCNEIDRSEEHTFELTYLIGHVYASFVVDKKKLNHKHLNTSN